MSDHARSASGRTSPEEEALGALEGAVARAVERIEALEGRLEEARSKGDELEEVVRRVTGDQAEGGRLLSRIRLLEKENRELRRRLAEGRQGVDRILARIRFLEEKG